MTEVTQILNALQAGVPLATDQLFSLVYGELRRLAAAQMAQERVGHTLNATALVHEAFLRLVPEGAALATWENRRHFFAAAAEAMRRILVEAARRRRSAKRGGGWHRCEPAEDDRIQVNAPDDVLAVDEALANLTREDPAAAELVKLRYFAGLSLEEAADTLGVSRATAARNWAYAKAWLRVALGADSENPPTA